MRAALLIPVALVCFAAPRQYPASGLVLALDRQHLTITISHRDIPGLMDAMAMPFHVRTAQDLDGLNVGDNVAFTLTMDRTASWVDNIRAVPFESAEREPVQTERLRVLELATGAKQQPPLGIGQRAPDFHLTDQDNRPVALSNFAGKVVALDFIYTRCPLPDYCFRLSSNFARLQKRFAADPRVVLLTVSFDPAHDHPEELARYARIWKADPRRWHFLTGSPADIRNVCSTFGVEYWPDEGVFTHSLHTIVLDGERRLAANIEGNKFSAEQVGDLIEATLKASKR